MPKRKAQFGELASRAVLQILPLLAILILLMLVGALIWLAEKNDSEESRLDLIRDALWVSETLDFSASSKHETLLKLASDIADGRVATGGFSPRARQLQSIYPEIVELSWRNSANQLIATGQHVLVDGNGPNQAISAKLSEVAQTAQRARNTMSLGLIELNNAAATGLVTPVTSGPYAGSYIYALISLDELLQRQIPWWVAQKRAVTLVNSDGTLLASRTKLPPGDAAPSHTIALAGTDAGIFLKLMSYQTQTNLAQNILLGAIIVLALIAAISLWARDRQFRRRLEAETRLREAHAFRMAMEDSLTVGMRARDLDGHIISVNPAFCRMVGWSAGELIGHIPPMPYWTPEDMLRTLKFHQSVLRGEAPGDGIELRFQRRDGERFDALVYEAPLIDFEGHQLGWMGSFVDISERKKAEALAREQSETLERTARLVTIGEMASLLAHELNQPLAAITSYNTGLLNGIDAGLLNADEIRGALTKSGEAAQRAGRVIRRVQDFVKKSDPRFEAFNIVALATETVDYFLREDKDKTAMIRLDITPSLPDVLGDRVLIEQVLVNLIRNANEAMSQLPARKRRIDVKLCQIQNEIEVRVADNGPGLQADLKAKLFTPFVTTKPGGMGLGLTICRSILEVHHGRLVYEDGANGGAIFSFRLPVTKVG